MKDILPCARCLYYITEKLKYKGYILTDVYHTKDGKIVKDKLIDLLRSRYFIDKPDKNPNTKIKKKLLEYTKKLIY